MENSLLSYDKEIKKQCVDRSAEILCMFVMIKNVKKSTMVLKNNTIAYTIV